jgi:membrane-associated protease RseP (regulator of RpoE activity)
MSDPTPRFPVYEIQQYPELTVVSRPKPRYWLHGLLLGLTVLTTLTVGARLEHNFLLNLPAYTTDEDLFPFFWALRSPARLLMGVPFSASLLLILLAHEMGHYLYCVRYRVAATLPFFIPAPTLIGTLGAFIRIKGPIRSRRALFDIGIAGPIAGFVIALPILFLSLAISRPMPGMGESDIQFGFPLIFALAHRLLGGAGAAVPLTQFNLHPMARAAWVGMFATALNLLPGGQLDGGHIVYSLWPRAHRYISWLTVGILLPMGKSLWAGWFVWAVLLTASGMRHPRIGPAYARFLFADEADPWPKLGRARWLLAVLALVMLALTFMPQPIAGL